MPVFVSENNIKKRLSIQSNAFTFLSWEGTNTKGCKEGLYAASLHMHPRDF